MALYKVLITKNIATYEQFCEVKSQLEKLDNFIEPADCQSMFSPYKDDSKLVYSVDAGCFINELRAFCLAVNYYLGTYRTIVTVRVVN